MASKECGGVVDRGSGVWCVGSHVVVGGVYHVSARWSCSAVSVLLAGIVRLVIEAQQARSRLPGGRGNTGSGISRSAEAVTSCPHERNRDLRANIPANFRVRAPPLGREKGNRVLDCSSGFRSTHTDDG